MRGAIGKTTSKWHELAMNVDGITYLTLTTRSKKLVMS